MNKRKYLIANIDKTKFVDIDQVVSARLIDYENNLICETSFDIIISCTNGENFVLASYKYSQDNKEKVEAFARDELSELLLLMALPDNYRESKYLEKTEDGDIPVICLTPKKLCEDLDNYKPKSSYRQLTF